MADIIKTDITKLAPGDKLSRLAYYEVVKANDKSIIVKNQHDFKFQISNGIVENEMYTACQYNDTKKVSRTGLVEILEKAGDTIFTVTFYKQVTEAHICDVLKNTGDLSKASERKKLAKSLIRGTHRTLTGFLVHTEPKMGRSKVVDLNVKKGYNNRLVDHRTIESIIIKNIKYVVK